MAELSRESIMLRRVIWVMLVWLAGVGFGYAWHMLSG